MKQKTHVKLFTLGLVTLVLLTINCGKAREKSKEQVAEQLLRFLNKQLPGSSYQVKPENRVVEPIGNNCYRITFKDFTFNTDLPGIVSTIFKIMYKNIDFPKVNIARIEEAVMTYDADKNDIRMHWLKNMKVEYELPELPGNNPTSQLQGARLKKIHGNVGKITYKDLNVDTRMKTGKKDMPKIGENPFQGVLLPFDSTIENLKFGITVVTKQEDLISFFLEIEKMGNTETGPEDADAFIYLLDKDAPPPDLNRTLKKGLAIVDVNFQVGRVKVSIEKNGTLWGSGAMDNVSYSLFLKPDDSGNRFKFGFGIEIKNLKLSIPGKEEIELLGNVKELRHDYSMENLSNKATLAFLKLFRNFFQLRALDHLSMREIMFQAFHFQAEMYNSKPVIKFSISPLKHYFGGVEAKLHMRLPGLLAVPEGKMSVRLFKIDETLNKLKETNLLSPGVWKTILQILDKYTVREENGDASMTFELDPAYPGKYFLNGKIRELRKSAVPQYRLF